MRDKIVPRGVFKYVATDTYDKTEIPRFGAWGKQSCEDTGPLTQKRMETIDEEVLAETKDFITRTVKGQYMKIKLYVMSGIALLASQICVTAASGKSLNPTLDETVTLQNH